ncbi:hypothetical protein CCACVL1_01065 [Corchorus capsularis]|uniref:Uncharacterized protein n=1 Tax=Corchorus capsularis TaxID=210143 RepID=A0A1R3KQJ7_COCAP|nr:hypothetical protein CCACVL1_01065 [Corchorus capsularis]
MGSVQRSQQDFKWYLGSAAFY